MTSIVPVTLPGTFETARLVRAIGRWTLAGLVINSMVGSGIFRLPTEIAGLLGSWSPWAWVVAAAGMAVIMACVAEVSSRFSEAGGPYLYARAAFGPLLGMQMAWFAWLVRLTSGAANANIFVIYLAEFLPGVRQAGARVLVLSVLIGVLVAVNYRGVKGGARLSNIFVVGKVALLALFAGLGVMYLLLSGSSPASAAVSVDPGAAQWLKAVLLLVFAYGGFEAALIPMAEARSPRTDAPFALFIGLLTCVVLYVLVQVVVVSVLTSPAEADRPLSAAALVFLGPAGSLLITVGALVSFYGYLGSAMLNCPRLTFALAQRGDFPAVFAAIHPRFRTPHVSILVFGVLVWFFAVFWGFVGNVTLSAISRLFTYGLVCAALPVLRRREPEGAAFRLPWGTALALGGILFSIALLTQITETEVKVMLAVVTVALINWVWVRRRTPL